MKSVGEARGFGCAIGLKDSAINSAAEVQEPEQGVRIRRIEVVPGDEAEAALPIEQVLKVWMEEIESASHRKGDCEVCRMRGCQMMLELWEQRVLGATLD